MEKKKSSSTQEKNALKNLHLTEQVMHNILNMLHIINNDFMRKINSLYKGYFCQCYYFSCGKCYCSFSFSLGTFFN